MSARSLLGCGEIYFLCEFVARLPLHNVVALASFFTETFFLMVEECVYAKRGILFYAL